MACIRVVCAFIDDIYTIADLITKQDDITVIQVKDYIKNPKPNGYRSYHMIVEIPVFFSGNMSLGVALLCQLTRQTVALFPEADVEIVEIHHNRKVDAPSGTARMLFDAVKEARPDAIEHDGRSGECKREKNEVGISSLRMGNVVGVHEVYVCTPSQTITLRHEVHNRAMLAEGGVEAARFMVGKPAGMYNMTDLLKG